MTIVLSGLRLARVVRKTNDVWFADATYLCAAIGGGLLMPPSSANGSSSPARLLALEGFEPPIGVLVGVLLAVLTAGRLYWLCAAGEVARPGLVCCGLGGVAGVGLAMAFCSAMDFLTNKLSTPASL
jgi:hypothetical protein